MDWIQYTYKRYIYIFDIKSKISFVKNKTRNHELNKHQISFWTMWNNMYMDEIQHTYKPCKLFLILSIHENERYILENQNG